MLGLTTEASEIEERLGECPAKTPSVDDGGDSTSDLVVAVIITALAVALLCGAVGMLWLCRNHWGEANDADVLDHTFSGTAHDANDADDDNGNYAEVDTAAANEPTNALGNATPSSNAPALPTADAGYSTFRDVPENDARQGTKATTNQPVSRSTAAITTVINTAYDQVALANDAGSTYTDASEGYLNVVEPYGASNDGYPADYVLASATHPELQGAADLNA